MPAKPNPKSEFDFAGAAQMFDKNKIYAELASQGSARQSGVPQIASGYNPKSGGGFFDDISCEATERMEARTEPRSKTQGGADRRQQAAQQRETDLMTFGETHVGGRGGGGGGGGRGGQRGNGGRGSRGGGGRGGQRGNGGRGSRGGGRGGGGGGGRGRNY
jgi:hypothetical protein